MQKERAEAGWCGNISGKAFTGMTLGVSMLTEG
jgi:hypothetical protein